jgi:hypothetical protein
MTCANTRELCVECIQYFVCVCVNVSVSVNVFLCLCVCVRIAISSYKLHALILLQEDTVDELRTQAARALGACVAIWLFFAAVSALSRSMAYV